MGNNDEADESKNNGRQTQRSRPERKQYDTGLGRKNVSHTWEEQAEEESWELAGSEGHVQTDRA